MFDKKDKHVIQFALGPGQKRFDGYLEVGFPNKEEPLFLDCVIDTGADRIVVPWSYWNRYITEAELKQVAIEECPIPRIQGTGLVLRLEVRISGLNHDDHSLGECEVVFALDSPPTMTPLKYVLLGLGALAQGGLCINMKAGDAWLVIVDA